MSYGTISSGFKWYIIGIPEKREAVQGEKFKEIMVQNLMKTINPQILKTYNFKKKDT